MRAASTFQPSFGPSALDLADSALVRRALSEDRFHVTEYLPDGDYPGFEAEKSEVEAHVAHLSSELALGSAAPDLEFLELCRRRMFLPEEIAAAGSAEGVRQLSFVWLQLLVQDAVDQLETKSFDPPQADDPVFAAESGLFEALTRDGLLPLTSDRLPGSDLWAGSDTVLISGDDLLHPHPRLAPRRELLAELLALAEDSTLSVSVAIHPFRRTKRADLRARLLEDYWSGIKLTPENLDSLDRHATGTKTFHAAVGRSQRYEFLNPLLGTWFDWSGRGDDESDPVKRLYVREVRPPTDRGGTRLAAIENPELHAERDTATHAFVHVDGKVCRYEGASYSPTRNSPMSDPGKPVLSRKLWRVDGTLTDEQWGTLVGLHFRGNELIEEHFREAFPAWPAPRES